MPHANKLVLTLQDSKFIDGAYGSEVLMHDSLDDFSKALSGEVRSLLKEVGDLRENRRALYM